ncbi:MAG: CDP-alcohol phosphatidyltransferase family protein [Oscillospiraceae bacterium]|jgi:CDP-diacylglycerol--glycerol-3-phosphate 3-phosphatidyltransferase|nr:CDP-alcohol phosphatidyltransferase family protein [Oscillospiraceae bacterium]
MIPNLLSAFRICLVPVFYAAYFLDSHAVKVYALAVYALASFTDFLDGYIARKFKLTSNLGKILDPLGDKLMMVSVLTCITIDGVIPLWALITAGIKEALMGIGGLVIHRKVKSDIPPSNILGKTSTVVFFLVCATLMLFPAIPGSTAALMIGVAIALMLMALGSYILTFTAVIKRRSNAG